MIYQDKLAVDTRGRGCYDIGAQVAASVRSSGIETGICHLFIRHTSASMMLCENADPDVLRDLEAWMARAVPDGDSLYAHTSEGPDDMPAHVRSVLTQSDLNLPVRAGVCALGQWQGIYLWEHRHSPHTRQVVVTVYGETA